jgi:hypothetical protein
MSNSSGTFKTGERVLQTGAYECLICRSMGKKTVVTFEEGKIFPFCAGCETKDATFRITGKIHPAGTR